MQKRAADDFTEIRRRVKELNGSDTAEQEKAEIWIVGEPVTTDQPCYGMSDVWGSVVDSFAFQAAIDAGFICNVRRGHVGRE